MTTPDGSIGTIRDLYVGVKFPDGRFASWIGAEQSTLVIGPAPTPLERRMTFDGTRTLTVRHSFGGGDPGGWYVLFAIVVRPGRDPLNPNDWIDGAVFTMLFDTIERCFLGPIDCALPPRADVADVIVVFIPDHDVSLVTGPNELVIPGRIVSVERGSVSSGTPIIQPANRLMGPLRGVFPSDSSWPGSPTGPRFIPSYWVSSSC